MKRIFGFIVAVSMTVLTIGCGDSSLNISSNSNGTQVQNMQKEAERLTFSLDSKEYSIPIQKVDSINKYLEQLDQSDRETEIKRISLIMHFPQMKRISLSYLEKMKVQKLSEIV